jgi:hypothetical protein
MKPCTAYIAKDRGPCGPSGTLAEFGPRWSTMLRRVRFLRPILRKQLNKLEKLVYMVRDLAYLVRVVRGLLQCNSYEDEAARRNPSITVMSRFIRKKDAM